MPTDIPAANAALDPAGVPHRLKRLAEENIADELIIEPARKRIKARETEMLNLLQGKEVAVSEVEESETVNHAAKRDIWSKSPEPLSGFYRMLKSFKERPPFDEHLSCPTCGVQEIDKPVWASCFHLFCYSCFLDKVIEFLDEVKDVPDKYPWPKMMCRGSHSGRYFSDLDIKHRHEIQGYAELSAKEMDQIKRMFKGEDIDIQALAAQHQNKPNEVLRREWQKARLRLE